MRQRSSRSVVSVALAVGFPMFFAGFLIRGCVSEAMDESAKQSEKLQRIERAQKAVAKANKICRGFPGEKICQVAAKERDSSWADKVQQCFSDEEAPSVNYLPDECNSFGGKGFEDLILPGSMVTKEEGIGPVTAPAILSEQIKQGEAIAKGISPQTVVIAGEVVMKENFARLVNEIAASHSATGKLPGPSEEGYLVADAGDPIEDLIEKHRLPDGTLQPVPAEESEATFAHILDGQLYPEIKTEIEQSFELKLGLSRNLEGLSETDKQGVGMVIGLFNHVARLHEEARQRVRVRGQQECAKYPPGTLRPTRCGAFRRSP